MIGYQQVINHRASDAWQFSYVPDACAACLSPIRQVCRQTLLHPVSDSNLSGCPILGGEKCSTEDLEEWDNLTRYYQRRGVEVFGDKPDEWEKNKQRKRLERMRIARRRMHKGSEGSGVLSRPEGRRP